MKKTYQKLMKNEKVLQEFVKRVKERYGDKVEKIILFGSYARGEAREDSDIDVLIITKKEDFRLRRGILGLAFDLLFETREYISPKVISKDDYEHLIDIQTSFIKNVIEDGIIVG